MSVLVHRQQILEAVRIRIRGNIAHIQAPFCISRAGLSSGKIGLVITSRVIQITDFAGIALDCFNHSNLAISIQERTEKDLEGQFLHVLYDKAQTSVSQTFIMHVLAI